MTAFKFTLYLLAVLTCLGCTVLLAREYFKRRIRLLLWSAVCFVGLTINNVFLFLDLVMFPAVDLRVIRLVAALAGMLCLLYAFMWEVEAG